MNGNLEPWMNPDEWEDRWAPLPKKYGPHPAFELHVNDYQVTEADVQKFKEKGYWLGPKIIDDDTIKLLSDEMKRVYKGEIDFPNAPYEYYWWLKAVRNHHNNHKGVQKINNAWYINAAFRKLSQNPTIGAMAAKLLGTNEVRLWHDQAIWKSGEGKDAKGEGNIGWHQDYSYWQISNTTNMLTAWIPLQDVNLENGAMRTISGSHKWGLKNEATTFFEKDMDALKDKFAAMATGPWQDDANIMKAGQVVFHHSLTFHGSGPNFTDEPRLAYALHLMPKGTAYVPGNGCHHNVKDLGPNAKAGTLFDGDCFPVVYRSAKSEHFDYP